MPIGCQCGAIVEHCQIGLQRKAAFHYLGIERKSRKVGHIAVAVVFQSRKADKAVTAFEDILTQHGLGSVLLIDNMAHTRVVIKTLDLRTDLGHQIALHMRHDRLG